MPGLPAEDQEAVLREEKANFNTILEGIRANSLQQANLVFHCLLFTHEKVKELTEALKGNTSLTRLRCGMGLGHEGIASLVLALRDCRVQGLELSASSIGDQGVMVLANAVKDLSLRELRLPLNNIHDEGAIALLRALGGSALTCLDLGSNIIGEAGVESLAESLKEVSIKELELGNIPLGLTGFTALAGKLAGSQVKKLVLAMTNMGDAEAEILAAGLKGSLVAELNVSSNKVSDKGAAAIAAVLADSDLTNIWMMRTNVGEEGCQAFLQALPTCGLHFLALSAGACGPEAKNQIDAALKANRNRVFVLQLEVKGAEPEWQLMLRTMGGTLAAVLDWSADRPAHELRDAAFEAMKTSGFQLPCKRLRAHNLSIVRPNGEVLDVHGNIAEQLADFKKRRLT